MTKKHYETPEQRAFLVHGTLACASPAVENSSIIDLGETDWSSTGSWE